MFLAVILDIQMEKKKLTVTASSSSEDQHNTQHQVANLLSCCAISLTNNTPYEERAQIKGMKLRRSINNRLDIVR